MSRQLWLAGRAVTVGAHVAAEKIWTKPPRARTDVPRNGVSLTPEWLTAVLCREVPGAEVVSWRSPRGSSGTSERAALRVEYDAAGAAAGLPTQLFTKCTASFTQRLLLGGADVLAGETSFFMTFRPAVEMEAPIGYWGAVDDRSWRSIIVLEDIAESKGATFVEPTTPLSRGQVEDVLRNMAAYHGAWWESPELKVLKTPTDHYDNVAQMLDFEGRCRVGMDRARSVIPPALLGQADRMWRGTQVGLAMCTDEMPTTLLHGDPHAGQTYRTATGAMGLTDWQAVMRGGWSYDVAYFIASACAPDDRRAWERELLEHYLEHLAIAGGVAPELDEAMLRYRQSMFYPYSAWAFTIGRAWYQPKMQPDEISLAIIERIATAIDDLDCFGALGI
ncbi:aminoglycoside phosphotransferase family protein [Nocardioides immobilis]|uniref:Aminoglycoside phosphotransferase family protein n=1 Tax=Nocardioides immobilis TaxID=2049295 RepID=A0A417Y641_9ACTN|nr:phosphotransferase [Nocardioides immobilis]RHW28158.1 aminoglycoside phosphotransferase family protein [Nocardioides immobilis]